MHFYTICMGFYHDAMTPMPGWRACRPPADPEEDHRARPIVLENHMEACYEGRRIVLIPECELRVLLPRMLCQREELRAQAAFVKTQLDQEQMMGSVPHTTGECFIRRRADQLEHLVCIGEKEARLSQAIGHTFEHLLVLNPLAVINGPYL